MERCRDLQVRSYGGGSSRFSGHVRLMQRPELVKTRRSAAAAVGLERQYSRERRKTMEATGEWRLMGLAYL